MFRARLAVQAESEGERIEFGFDIEAQAIPQLERSGLQLGLQRGGKKVRLIGLVGRDLLRHTRIRYDGADGFFQVELNLDSITASYTN